MSYITAVPQHRTILGVQEFRFCLTIILMDLLYQDLSFKTRRRGGILDDIEDFFNGGHDEEDTGDQISDEDEDDDECEVIEDEDDNPFEQDIDEDDDDDGFEPLLPEDDEGELIRKDRQQPRLQYNS